MRVREVTAHAGGLHRVADDDVSRSKVISAQPGRVGQIALRFAKQCVNSWIRESGPGFAKNRGQYRPNEERHTLRHNAKNGVHEQHWRQGTLRGVDYRRKGEASRLGVCPRCNQ